jgi:hypothetical protein
MIWKRMEAMVISYGRLFCIQQNMNERTMHVTPRSLNVVGSGRIKLANIGINTVSVV